MHVPRPLDELPAEVLDDVAAVVGAEVTLLGRLPGGVNGGALRVRVAGRDDAVLKTVPRAHPGHLDETLRAQRVVEHMRGRGYPTPAWLGVGATATHVWHLTDVVDAAPAPELTPSLVEQLMEIIELQAGQASEPYDHWSYAWRVATGQGSAAAGLAVDETPEQLRLRRSMAELPRYSAEVSALVERLRLAVCRRPTATRGAGHGPRRSRHPRQRPGPGRGGGGGRGHRERRQRHAGDRSHRPRSGTATGIRCSTVSDGGCGRGSSSWSAVRARRCWQRHRSCTCSRSPSGTGATTSSQGWSSAVIAPSTS